MLFGTDRAINQVNLLANNCEFDVEVFARLLPQPGGLALELR